MFELVVLQMLFATVGGHKIEHVVVLVMENRPFDHFFGLAGEELPGIDGLNGSESSPVDPTNSSKVSQDSKQKIRGLQGSVSVLDGNATYVCGNGPSQAFSVLCADYFGPGSTDCAGPDYPAAQPRNGWVYENGPEAM